MLKGPCEASELEALHFVSQQTSIPVPRVHATYRHHDRLYIEMDYIEGETLDAAWRNYLLPDQKSKVLKKLKGFVEQLRELQPPQPEFVASAKGEGAVDYRIGTKPFGPYRSHDDFHSVLRGRIPLEDCSKVFAEVVTRCHPRKYRTHFCHADLAPRNIIVRGDEIAAIVDWQFSGWFPEYWEYTKAHYSLYICSDWLDGLRDAVGNYDEELQAERTLWAKLDQPGAEL